MLCRIVVGGFALVAASVVNAPAQSCLFPGACQETRSSAEKVKRNARGCANLPQNVKNNLPPQRRAPSIERGTHFQFISSHRWNSRSNTASFLFYQQRRIEMGFADPEYLPSMPC